MSGSTYAASETTKNITPKIETYLLHSAFTNACVEDAEKGSPRLQTLMPRPELKKNNQEVVKCCIEKMFCTSHIIQMQMNLQEHVCVD
jgi:hypothetical protein